MDDIANGVKNPQPAPSTPVGQLFTKLCGDGDNRHCTPAQMSASMSECSYYSNGDSGSWAGSQSGLDVIPDSQKRHGLANDGLSKYLLADNVASVHTDTNASSVYNARGRLPNGVDTMDIPNRVAPCGARNYGAVASQPAMIKTAFTNIKKNRDDVRMPSRAYDRCGSVGTATDANVSQLDDYVTFIAQDEGRTSASVTMHVESTPKTGHVNEKLVTSTWSKLVDAADQVSGEYVDLISFIDGGARERLQSSEFGGDHDQESIGQLSAIASSGYQSFGYSQSNSPVDARMAQPPPASQHPLSFANPVFGHNKSAVRSVSRSTRSPSLSSLSSNDSSKRSQHRHRCANINKDLRQSPAPVTVTTSHSVVTLSSSVESLSQLEGTVQYRAPTSHTPPFPSPCPSRISLPPDSRYPERLDAYSELSKSVEFSPVADSGMKRTVTDSVLSSSCYGAMTVSSYANLKLRSSSAASGNTVRMGVRSVQHRMLEQEKTKAEVS